MTAGQFRQHASDKAVLLPALAHTDPEGTAALLTSRVPGVTVEASIRCEQGREPVTAFLVRIEPPVQFAEHGYPTEFASVVVTSEVQVFPIRDSARRGRRFKHRNPGGDLCLFYAKDVPALVWLPEDGLEPLLAIAQRHFAAEEYWRRSGEWPMVDAPHGEPMTGTHPLSDRRLKRDVRNWKRVS